MTTITPKVSAQSVQEYRNKILTQAKNNLGGKTSVTLEEYSRMKGIDTFEAKEYDLNNDGDISVTEEACSISAKDLFDGLDSGMLMYRLFDFFGFRKEESNKNPRLNYYHQG